MKVLSVSDFFNNQFLDFSTYDCYRNITNLVDGLKLSQRKILFTVDKLNINSPIKVESLAPEAAKQTQYLHGSQSLIGVITGMATPWGIYNNMPLLAAKGNFGKRLNPEPSAPRYIYTYKLDIFDKLFRKEDRIILQQLNFEGEDIEYNHYLPIIPYAFTKICEGMGTGFSHLIFPRNPKDLINTVILLLEGKELQPLNAYCSNFSGTIDKHEDGGWVYNGHFEWVSKTKLRITELPIGYDLAGYNKVLNELEEKKIIKSFKDLSDTKKDKFLFEVNVSQEFGESALDSEVMQMLRLSEKISDNLTFLNENNQIVQFDSDIEVIKYWFDYRLKKYNERKIKYIELMEIELKTISNKYKFIKAIIDGKIIINNKSKKDIETQIINFKIDDLDGSYDYLLNMPIYSLTKEKADQLKKELEDKKLKVEEYKNTDVKIIWKNELIELQQKLGC